MPSSSLADLSSFSILLVDIDAWGLSLYGSLSVSPKTGSSLDECAPNAQVYTPSSLFPAGENYNVSTCGTRLYYWNATHLYAVGANYGGALGTNNLTYTDTRCLGAIQITTISDEGEDLAGVSCSSTTVMAWTRSGRVFGWGGNTFQQIDASSVSFASPTPIAMPFSKVVKISMGQEHTLALSDEGEVACWGRNRWNQCNSNPNYVFPPTKTFLGVNASDVSAGSLHSLVLSTDGTAYAAGFNHYGQTCQTSIAYRAETPTTVSNPPTAIVGDAFYGKTVSKIAATRSGSLFLTEEGRLFGCGMNSAMGFGSVVEPYVDRPREIFVLPPDAVGGNTPISSIFSSASAYHTLFATDDLRLAGVGTNSAGELGLNQSIVMSTKTILSLSSLTADITNNPISKAAVSGYQSVVETDSALTRPDAEALRPQCNIQGCSCPAPLPDAICVDGGWTGPNLVIWSNITVDVNLKIVGNLTLAPGGSLSMPFGSVIQIPGGCAQFYGGVVNYTISPAQLLQIYSSPLLFVNTTCGGGVPVIHLNINGTVDPCNNVTVAGTKQTADGLYMIFVRTTCKDKLKLWIIGVVIAAVVGLVVIILLLAFLIKPIRLIIFPFYKRQIVNEGSETTALRAAGSELNQGE